MGIWQVRRRRWIRGLRPVPMQRTGAPARRFDPDQSLSGADQQGGSIKAGRRRMKDFQANLEKLRRDATEAALIRDLAMDRKKREIFDRLARHLNQLADEVEQAMPKARDEN